RARAGDSRSAQRIRDPGRREARLRRRAGPQRLKAAGMAELISYRTKREIAIAALRDAILSGRYPAGVRLEQNRIAAELGLSPTPVREAFRELLARGLLVQKAHHSVRVAEIKLDELRHLYGVRSLLEAEAARLATASISDEIGRAHV